MDQQLTPGRKWAYAFANAGSFVNMTLYTTFPLIFITAVLHYPVSYGVAILTVDKITSIAFTFVSGPLVEKVKLPWGKYRSWFLVSPIICAVSCVLFFSPLLLHVPQAMVIPLGSLLVMGYQLGGIPRGVGYNAMNRLLSSDSLERVRLNKLATQMQGVILFVCGLFVWRVIYAVGHQQSINMPGMQVIAVTYGFLNFLFYFIFFLSLKGFDETAGGGGGRGNASILTSFKILFTNGKLAAAIIGMFFCFSTETFCKVVVSFYILYVLGSPEMMANYSWAIVVAMLVGTFMAVPLVKKTGSKKVTFLMGFILSGLALVGAYFAVDLKIPLIGLLCICLSDMGVGVGRSVCVPIFGDIADHAKAKDGKDTTSYIMALYNLIFKLAGLVAAQASGLVGRIGFNPRGGVEPTPEILEGVRKVTTLGPASLAVVGVLIVLLFYHMDEKALKAARGGDAAPVGGH
jgi:Na+/melibiose symporter-like transporter